MITVIESNWPNCCNTFILGNATASTMYIVHITISTLNFCSTKSLWEWASICKSYSSISQLRGPFHLSVMSSLSVWKVVMCQKLICCTWAENAFFCLKTTIPVLWLADCCLETKKMPKSILTSCAAYELEHQARHVGWDHLLVLFIGPIIMY